MKHLIFSLAALTAVVSTAAAQSEAFCALRDPVRQIYLIYPGADAHRSIVRSVGPKARHEVASQLPFGLHFNELGKHTLYVAAKSGRPMGLIHVRSEVGRWGLMEIAWALDLDLRVRDFTFQRCRSRQRKKLSTKAFRANLIGKNLSELGALLTKSGKSSSALKAPRGTEGLAAALVRSAMKTIVVTESVWKADLRILRLLDQGLRGFEGGASVQPVKQVYTQDVLHELRDRLAGNGSVFDRATVAVLRVINKDKKQIGIVVRTDWLVGAKKTVILWRIDMSGKLLAINAAGAETLPSEFKALKGRALGSFEDCASPTELAAVEVLTLSELHAKR